jgi:hypothetical protein
VIYTTFTLGGSPSKPLRHSPQAGRAPSLNLRSQAISAGLWRVDRSFASTIQIYNRHISESRTVFPTLYMQKSSTSDPAVVSIN